MRRTEVAQEIRKMQFESVYPRWNRTEDNPGAGHENAWGIRQDLRRLIFRYEQDGMRRRHSR